MFLLLLFLLPLLKFCFLALLAEFCVMMLHLHIATPKGLRNPISEEIAGKIPGIAWGKPTGATRLSRSANAT